MNLLQIFLEACRALAAKPLRTGLTMLGIVIGIASVAIMLTVGDTVRGFIDKQLALLGSNLLVVQPGAPRNATGVQGRAADAAVLTLADAAEIDHLPSVAGAAPTLQNFFQVDYGGENSNSTVIGSTPAMIRIRHWKLDQGVGISDDDVRTASPVIVIGANIADRYFYREQPLGRIVRVDGKPFTVIGVFAGTGRMFDGVDLGDLLLTPISALPMRMPVPGTVQSVIAQARDGGALKDATADMQDLLRDRHRIGGDRADDFHIVNLASIAQSGAKIGLALSLAFGVIGGISLLVGGVGIMNIMLVNVSERVREIGIRMAIGAHPRHILLQFLGEAVMMCVLGGLIGVGIAAFAAWGVTQTGQVTMTLTGAHVFVAVAFAAAVGVFFGWFPAHRASRMLPIECLRQD
jgi:putative ABC transport system permease protein